MRYSEVIGYEERENGKRRKIHKTRVVATGIIGNASHGGDGAYEWEANLEQTRPSSEEPYKSAVWDTCREMNIDYHEFIGRLKRCMKQLNIDHRGGF